MAYSVNWITRVISIPVSAMTPLGGSDYELSADEFWRELRRLEWDQSEGLWAPNILAHTNIRTLAGTTYVAENEIVNGYQILFDPTAQKVFLRGDNNNIVDVFIFNGVSVIPSNTAGNTISRVGSGLDTEQDDRLRRIEAGTVGNAVISEDGSTVTLYAEDGVTVLRTLAVTQDQKQRTIVP